MQSRFLGCLLGGAVGDALGSPVEFLDRDEILLRHGPAGITDFAAGIAGKGAISDDTQMTLFTCDGLLRGWLRERIKGGTSYPIAVEEAYLRWLSTQGEHARVNLRLDAPSAGWLYCQPALHFARAPGMTCISALSQPGVPGEPALNDSKGCGGVMRIAPVGLFSARLGDRHPPQAAFALGVRLAALTHGHPTGSLSAGVQAVLVRELVRDAPWQAALAIAKACLKGAPDAGETQAAIEEAEEIAGSDLAGYAAIERLGEGWVAEEALAIGIYCLLAARDLEQGIIIAANHSGDSDSTAAIAGNLLGALHGVEAIPRRWLDALELRAVITAIAEDLHQFPDWTLEQASWRDAQLQKYPID